MPHQSTGPVRRGPLHCEILDGLRGSSVNPRVQLREVIELHFLFTLGLVTECEHIFPSPVEVIQIQNSRIEVERSY